MASLSAACLEAAFVVDVFNENAAAEHLADPVSWTRLDFMAGQEDVEQSFEASGCPPGWKLKTSASCLVFVRELCTVVQCSAEDACWTPDGWRHTLRPLVGTSDLSGCRLVVREVPPGLVFQCALRVTQNERYEATFSTLAGVRVMRVEEDILLSLVMRQLLEHIRETAVATGRLRSNYQKIFVVVNDSKEEIAPNTLLWHKHYPIGWLQR